MRFILTLLTTKRNGQPTDIPSAGGNDAELVNILNQCVFQWFALNKVAEWLGDEIDNAIEWLGDALGTNWGRPIEVASRGCQEQLDISENIMKSSEFSGRVDRVLDLAKRKLSSE